MHKLRPGQALSQGKGQQLNGHAWLNSILYFYN
jgi:hypothetical protein